MYFGLGREAASRAWQTPDWRISITSVLPVATFVATWSTRVRLCAASNAFITGGLALVLLEAADGTLHASERSRVLLKPASTAKLAGCLPSRSLIPAGWTCLAGHRVICIRVHPCRTLLTLAV